MKEIQKEKHPKSIQYKGVILNILSSLYTTHIWEETKQGGGR